ncbi:MAG: baseplate J/gp47 family protein [Acidobacteria bacterium]|nr:baseplate J/gp47 family protein [Acidobacteriota bacterium]
MPITLPNLDDRRYADLVEEARSLIPTYAPEWTDHNESDPGMTLIELFSYLAEMLLYRLNRVTDANRYAFLKLLDPDLKTPPGVSLEEQTRATVLALREASRAITCADFEKLALEASERQTQPAMESVARAYCVARRNLEIQNEAERAEELPNHVSVVIVPRREEDGDEGGETEEERRKRARPQPSERLIGTVAAYLDERRLVTTLVHVAGPRYVQVRVQMTVRLTSDTQKSEREAVRERLEKNVLNFLSPLGGGPDGKGWPFGRNVYVSEIYEVLDRQPSVDYVKRSVVKIGDDSVELEELVVEPPDESRLKRTASGLTAVEVREDELVDALLSIKVELPGDDITP